MRQKLFVVIMFLMLGLGTGFAQQGFLKGKITDKKSGEELVGAAVVVDGTTTGTITDFTGEYNMPPLEAGTYTIRVQYVSYEPMVFNNVVVKAGEETVLNVKLSQATMDIGEVQVKGKANRESENMLLMDQKKAVVATQAIGAQELSRKGVGDAEGAVTKITGVSKQEGVKNVFVRGLGDRYNSTTFNKFPLPSEDPEYKNISLDFFSSDIIEAVSVNKVFTSNIDGNVGGANININSKSLNKDKILKLDIGAGVNTQTMSEEFLMLDGVSKFGFVSNKESGITNLNNYTFNNKLNVSIQDFQLNQSYSFSGGKKYEVGANRNALRFFVVGSYNSDFNFGEGTIKNSSTDGTIIRNQDYKKYTKEQRHMGMANLDYRFSNNIITYNFLLIHNLRQSVGDYIGLSGSENLIQSQRRQQTNDNTLLVNQLNSKWGINERINIEGGAAFNYLVSNEPDRRDFVAQVENGKYLSSTNVPGQRYFSELNENDVNLNLGIDYKLGSEEKESKLRLGYNGRFVNREFEARTFRHKFSTSIEFDPDNIEGLINQQGIDNNSFVFATTRGSSLDPDTYNVDKIINSSYLDLSWQLNQDITLNAGVRMDMVKVDFEWDAANSVPPSGKSSLEETFFLPSLNCKYSVNDKNALRLGLSRTYILPQAKEIAPFLYQDVAFTTQGNPDIKSSENYNLDIKWDYYMKPGELIAITGFYKIINDPIARTQVPTTGIALTYSNISDKATVAGVEFEFKKDLFKIQKSDDTYHKLVYGLNVSYLYSKMDPYKDPSVNENQLEFQNKDTELEGASPFLMNTDLSYIIKSNSTKHTASIVLSYFSDRVYAIGTVEGNARYENTIEKGIPTLDFVYSTKLKNDIGIKFKAKNLINPTYEKTRDVPGGDTAVIDSYEKGSSVSIGLSYTF